MTNLTTFQRELLDAVLQPKNNDEPEDNFFASGDEMYYNYNNKKKEKRKMNTFHHQMSENVLEASPLSSPSEPSAVAEATSVSLQETTLERKAVSGSGPKKGFKRLSTNDKYVEINVQVSNYRNTGRFKRINVYVSLKTDTDQTYSVFLSGSGTTAKAELKRGAKEIQSVLNVIEEFQTEIPDGMIARLHYKAPKGFVTDFHRGLLKSTMICIDECEGDFIAYFYLMGEYINIPLDMPLTAAQKKHYIASGIWQDSYNLSDEDEFDD